MVRNVFRLDERQIGSMMIPRAEIVWLDADAPLDEVLRADRRRSEHSRYPVCRGGLDDVLGVHLGAAPAAAAGARRSRRSLTECLQPPVFVPETLSGMELLEHFRASSAAARLRRRRVRRGAGRDHRARRARGDHRRVRRAGRRGRLGGAARRRQLAARRPDPGARAEGPPRPEGAARGGPRPLQHAGRHDHAAARPAAAAPPTGRMGGLALRGRRPRRQARRQGAGQRAWPRGRASRPRAERQLPPPSGGIACGASASACASISMRAPP